MIPATTLATIIAMIPAMNLAAQTPAMTHATTNGTEDLAEVIDLAEVVDPEKEQDALTLTLIQSAAPANVTTASASKS